MGIGMPIPRITPRHCIKDLIFVFVLLSIAVIGSVTFLSARARQDISQKYIDNAVLGALPVSKIVAYMQNRG